MEFIDDYRLLAILRETQSEPLSLALINTEGGAEVTHMKTIFFLPPFIDSYQFIDLLLECGAHEPSPAESLAPFHQDPSQRIVVLDLGNAPYYLVLRAEALLAFENRAGPNIRWDAWKGCVVMPLIPDNLMFSDVWVSGCRLFFLCQQDSSSHTHMEMYDFSLQGRARCLSGSVHEEFSGLRYLLPTGTRVPIPLDGRLESCSSGHGSLVFRTVSVIALCFI